MNATTNDTLDATVELFKAFADPVRLRLLGLIVGGEVCVCHLYESLDLPQSTVSRHLTYLRDRNLVVGRKEGLWVYYRLSKPIDEIHRGFLELLTKSGTRSEAMRRDRERLSLRSCGAG